MKNTLKALALVLSAILLLTTVTAFAEEEYAIAIAKDNTELLDKVNAALGELKESGKLDEIIGKYISAE